VRALPDGFEIVDQHALHERLTFEALRAEADKGQVEVQRRLVPELVEVGAAQASLLERTSRRWPRSHPRRALRPDDDRGARIAGALAARRRGGPGARRARDDRAQRAFTGLGRGARGGATQRRVPFVGDAGDELSEIEIRALLARARESSHDQTCPHARPTRVRFTLADLEKAFHRR